MKLGDLGKITTGTTPSKSNEKFYDSDDIMFIKPDNLSVDTLTLVNPDKNYISHDAMKKARIAQKGSVLITCIGIIGKISVVDVDKVAFNQQINAIAPDVNKVCTRYLAYALKYNRQKLESIANAPVVPIINKTKFSEFKIAITPCSKTQQEIANTLDKAQELIDKRKQQIQALDDLTQSVFYDMFGDPIRNERGWKKCQIKDLIVKTQYGTGKKADEEKGEIPVLRMNNITYKGSWNFSSLKYVDLDEKEKEKYLVSKGEVLFNRTNSKELVGKTAIYSEEEPMAYAGYLIKMIPNDKANGVFISAFLNSKYSKKVLFNMAKNIVGMANINAEELKAIKTFAPPIELQNKFSEVVQSIENQKLLLEKSLIELEINFNALMQQAFKGGECEE